MPKIPVAKAAKIAGVQRSTLYRKNKKGEISFSDDERGNVTIDASELLRVYPYIKPESFNEEGTQQAQQSDLQQKRHDATSIDIKLLQQELHFLREKIEDREKQLREAKDREQNLSEKLDKVQSVIERQTMLIEDMRISKDLQKSRRFLGLFKRA